MNEVEEVKARLDIVDVVGQYVQLQKAGRTFKAPCPFHAEKTPSFIVSPDRQSWHCFGACGTGGDVISFVMKREGLEFPEALRILAERAGVKLPERRVSEEQDRTRQRLYSANEAAAEYFRKRLASDAGRVAKEYLERRGVDDATAESFALGYSLPTWESARDHLTKLGFTDRELLSAGLLVQGDNGVHDRFRGRLMYPVWDARGRVIGFGARALDDSQPKYLNTAQTTLFDKGGTLYALNKAQEAVRREGRAVVVEGYMDVIAAHQFGFENVVAQMGTALTERQVRILKKLAPEVVLALDADAAGSEAAVRGHEVVRETLREEDGAMVAVVNWRGLVGYQETASVDLRVAVLPPGKDPDDFVREDPEKWRDLIVHAKPVLDFRLEAAVAAHDLEDPRGRSQLVQGFLPLLTAVTDPVVRAHYVQRLSRLAQVSEEALSAMATRPRAGRPQIAKAAAAAPNAPRRSESSGKEDFLLALLLQYPALRPRGTEIPDSLLWDAQARQVLDVWKREESGQESVKEAVPIELLSYVERLILWRLPISNEKEAGEALQDCIDKLNQRRLQAEKQAIAAQIADLQDRLGIAAMGTPGGTGESAGELQHLLLRDMEIASELHSRERRDGEYAVEGRVDG